MAGLEIDDKIIQAMMNAPKIEPGRQDTSTTIYTTCKQQK